MFGNWSHRLDHPLSVPAVPGQPCCEYRAQIAFRKNFIEELAYRVALHLQAQSIDERGTECVLPSRRLGRFVVRHLIVTPDGVLVDDQCQAGATRRVWLFHMDSKDC
jgi:hypothetical protein